MSLHMNISAKISNFPHSCLGIVASPSCQLLKKNWRILSWVLVAATPPENGCCAAAAVAEAAGLKEEEEGVKGIQGGASGRGLWLGCQMSGKRIGQYWHSSRAMTNEAKKSRSLSTQPRPGPWPVAPPCKRCVVTCQSSPS